MRHGNAQMKEFQNQMELNKVFPVFITLQSHALLSEMNRYTAASKESNCSKKKKQSHIFRLSCYKSCKPCLIKNPISICICGYSSWQYAS